MAPRMRWGSVHGPEAAGVPSRNRVTPLPRCLADGPIEGRSPLATPARGRLGRSSRSTPHRPSPGYPIRDHTASPAQGGRAGTFRRPVEGVRRRSPRRSRRFAAPLKSSANPATPPRHRNGRGSGGCTPPASAPRTPHGIRLIGTCPATRVLTDPPPGSTSVSTAPSRACETSRDPRAGTANPRYARGSGPRLPRHRSRHLSRERPASPTNAGRPPRRPTRAGGPDGSAAGDARGSSSPRSHIRQSRRFA